MVITDGKIIQARSLDKHEVNKNSKKRWLMLDSGVLFLWLFVMS